MSASYNQRTSLRIAYEMLHSAIQQSREEEVQTFDLLYDAELAVEKELFLLVSGSSAAFSTLMLQLSRKDSAGVKELERTVLSEQGRLV